MPGGGGGGGGAGAAITSGSAKKPLASRPGRASWRSSGTSTTRTTSVEWTRTDAAKGAWTIRMPEAAPDTAVAATPPTDR
jgi:hypothetical protein